MCRTVGKALRIRESVLDRTRSEVKVLGESHRSIILQQQRETKMLKERWIYFSQNLQLAIERSEEMEESIGGMILFHQYPPEGNQF
jgi:hypothetical protein